MFLVIGETAQDAQVIGEGKTIEAAIEDWGRGAHSAMAEFMTWNPKVFRAQLVEVEVSATVKEI